MQNFSLQKTIEKLGGKAVTIDFLRIVNSPVYIYIASWIKSFILLLLGKKRKFARYSNKGKRCEWSNEFVRQHIIVTQSCFKYTLNLLTDFDAVIVGSDQVWRPSFVANIKDMYLHFAQNYHIKRIAYAASFGVDNWEYSSKQTQVCSELANKFDAISVREESAIKLCREHLGVDATWVLDPTLLLTKEDYLPICKEVPVCSEKYLAVYVLDENDVVTATYEKEAMDRGLIVKKFYAASKSTLTVPEWLAMFRDASYVVTDSFHGTVFSIIFGKEFKCIYNKNRGAARFESLMNLYNSGKLEELRIFSLNWLKNALEK